MIVVMLPTIHLNGTDGASLEERAWSAYRAIGEAIDTLGDAAPNARDYYPQGDGAMTAAQREHDDRIKRLKAVRDEMKLVWQGISEQNERRAAQRKAR